MDESGKNETKGRVWGDGRIFKPKKSRFWHIAYCGPRSDGTIGELRESSKSEDDQAALRLLRKRVRAVKNSREGIRPFIGPSEEKITVADLLDELERHYETKGIKSLSGAKVNIRHLRDFFGNDRAAAIAPDRGGRIGKYIAKRQADKMSNATINRELEKLQRAFALAINRGTLSSKPHIESLSEFNARQGFVPRADFDAILSKIEGEDDRDFFSWLYWTGMRPGAVIALTWACFEKETWTLYLPAKDDKIGRGIPWELTGAFRAIIERRLRSRRLDSDRIFHRDGRAIDNHYLRAWHAAETAAKVSHRLVYDLRRTALRNNVRAGVPERVAMAISGHRTRAVFDRYNIVSGEDLREAATMRAVYEEKLPTNRDTGGENVSDLRGTKEA
jgi:integrase